MHLVENDFIRICAREYGAELTSVFDKKNNIEHLWQADPRIWGWHAPVLFPVVGRCLNDTIVVDGVKYPLERHGFARKSNFKLMELSDSRMVFSLKSNADTLRVYPCQFELLIAYRLLNRGLQISYEVVNNDNKPIYFSIGGHPAFAVPFLPGERYDDYYLEFEKPEEACRYYINEDGFFDGRKDIALANTNTLSLKPHMFRDDALIFKDLKSRKVTIRSKNHPHSLSVDFTGFDLLGLWAKPDAPYVCIEPWLGCADTAGKPVELKDKEGIICLQAKQEFGVSFTIEVD
jgi:galactose mutarotase-like enzyme